MLLIDQNSPITKCYLVELLEMEGWHHSTDYVDIENMVVEEDEDGFVELVSTEMSVVSVNDSIGVLGQDGTIRPLTVEFFSNVDVYADGEEYDYDVRQNPFGNITINLAIKFSDNNGDIFELDGGGELFYSADFWLPDIDILMDIVKDYWKINPLLRRRWLLIQKLKKRTSTPSA